MSLLTPSGPPGRLGIPKYPKSEYLVKMGSLDRLFPNNVQGIKCFLESDLPTYTIFLSFLDPISRKQFKSPLIILSITLDQ